MTKLQVRELEKRFGGLVALDGVSFEVNEGEIIGLIGPNGAGKTTLLNCISRFCDPEKGSILWGDKNLLRCSPAELITIGIGRTFQQALLFKGMTVLDNVLVGLHAWPERKGLQGLTRLAGGFEDEAARRRRAREMLNFFSLGPWADNSAGALSFGMQKRVDLARALAIRPSLLLLDEPASGLSHEEISGMAETILRIRDDFRVTVLLVEHHMELVMRISDRVCVLDFGRKIAEGLPKQVAADPAVIAAYLGTEDVA